MILQPPNPFSHPIDLHLKILEIEYRKAYAYGKPFLEAKAIKRKIKKIKRDKS